MAKFPYIIFIFLIGLQSTLFAQKSALEAYTNKLLFNYSTDEIDSNLCRFLNKHVSNIYCQPKSTTDTVQGWNTNEKITAAIIPPIVSTHAFYFRKHPYLKENFSSGKIEFWVSENFIDKIWIDNISLFLYFEEKKEALKVFQKMVDTFTKMSSQKKIDYYNETINSQFTDNSIKNKSPFGVKLIFAKDNVSKNGSYYILFIPHNNL
jgi:hypothetical protein